MEDEQISHLQAPDKQRQEFEDRRIAMEFSAQLYAGAHFIDDNAVVDTASAILHWLKTGEKLADEFTEEDEDEEEKGAD